jgi:hypothetical protein
MSRHKELCWSCEQESAYCKPIKNGLVTEWLCPLCYRLEGLEEIVPKPRKPRVTEEVDAMEVEE